MFVLSCEYESFSSAALAEDGPVGKSPSSEAVKPTECVLMSADPDDCVHADAGLDPHADTRLDHAQVSCRMRRSLPLDQRFQALSIVQAADQGCVHEHVEPV